ncbi:hypothetical protein CR513_24667, partial [Mucuna pruriens]
MNIWNELRERLDKHKTIHKKLATDDYERVKGLEIIVKCLTKHNLTFRGSNEKLYQDSNCNFWRLIEMLVEFDVIMQDHVNCIQNHEIHSHYLGYKV